MATLLSVRQHRRIEAMDAPLTSSQLTGGRPTRVSSPAFNNSGPVFKASHAMQGVRLKKFRMPKLPQVKIKSNAVKSPGLKLKF